jgi:hypothetical protein
MLRILNLIPCPLLLLLLLLFARTDDATDWRSAW